MKSAVKSAAIPPAPFKGRPMAFYRGQWFDVLARHEHNTERGARCQRGGDGCVSLCNGIVSFCVPRAQIKAWSS